MTGANQQVGQVLTIHVHVSQDPEVLAAIHVSQLNGGGCVATELVTVLLLLLVLLPAYLLLKIQ